MNKLKFDAKSIDLYSADYNYLQDNISEEISKTFRQMLSNPGTPAILRGFTLEVSTSDPTTVMLTTENGYSSMISSTGILIEETSVIDNIELSDSTLNTLNYFYARVYSEEGSYNRSSGVFLPNEKKAIDLANYTLEYDREEDTWELLVYTHAEISALSSSYLNSLIYLGRTTAQGTGNPLLSIDLSGRRLARTNIQPESITTDMISPTGFILPQDQVGSSEIINDYFTGTKETTEDDANEIRTLIREMKGTGAYNDPSPTTLYDFDRSINAVHENGVFKYSGYELEVVPSSSGLAVDIKSGLANVGGSISRVLDGTQERLVLTTPSYTTVGDWEAREGQNRRFNASPDVYEFYLFNDNEETSTGIPGEDFLYVPGLGDPRFVDLSSIRITNSVNGPAGTNGFVQDVDYVVEASTGLVTVLSGQMIKTWNGDTSSPHASETTDRLFKCYFDWGNPRYDAVTIAADNVYTVFDGTQAVASNPPVTSSNVVNLAYVYVRPFATEIISEDITDSRYYIDKVREIIDIPATQYNNVRRSVERINYLTSSGVIDSSWEHWAINIKEAGDVVVETSTGGASFETVVYAKEDDELWLITNKTPWINDITIEFSDPNSDVLLYSLDVDLFFNTFLYKYPVYINKAFDEGYVRIKITVSDTSEYFTLFNIIVGKLDLYYNIHSLSDIDYIVPQQITNLEGVNAPVYRYEDDTRRGRLLKTLENKSICGSVGRLLNRWDIEQKYPVSRIGNYETTGDDDANILDGLDESLSAVKIYFTIDTTIIGSEYHQRVAINFTDAGADYNNIVLVIHDSEHNQIGDTVLKPVGDISVGYVYFELPVTIPYNSGETYHYHVYYTGTPTLTPTVECIDDNIDDKGVTYLQFYKPKTGLYKSTDVINIIDKDGTSIITERTEGEDSAGNRYDLNQLDIMPVDFSNDTTWETWEYDWAPDSADPSDEGLYIGIDVETGRVKFPAGYDANDYYVEFNTKELGTKIDSKSVIRHGTSETIEDFITRTNRGSGIYQNAIINSNFDIWQRNTTFTIDTSSGIYTADRMIGYIESGTATVSRTTINDGYSMYAWKIVKATGTSADPMGLLHKIPYIDAVKFNACTAMFGFDIKRNTLLDNDVTVEIYKTTSADTSTGLELIISEVIDINDLSNTDFRQFQVSVDLTTHTDVTNIWIKVYTQQSGSDAFGFEVRRLQFNEGNELLTYQPKSFDEELTACEKYFQYAGGEIDEGLLATGYLSTTSEFVGMIQYNTMYQIPSADISDVTHFEVRSGNGTETVTTDVTLTALTKKSGRVVATVSGTPFTAGQGALLQSDSNLGKISFSAEI